MRVPQSEDDTGRLCDHEPASVHGKQLRGPVTPLGVTGHHHAGRGIPDPPQDLPLIEDAEIEVIGIRP